jgi:signal peptidase I
MTDQGKNSRKPIIAFLLSLFTPGLGHIYVGKLKIGLLLFLVSQVVLSFLYSWFRVASTFYGLASVLTIEAGLRIFIIANAVFLCYRQKDYVLQPFNKLGVMILIGVAMLSTPIVISKMDMLGIMTFRIPTSSNEPTIKVNDYMVSDLTYYKNNSVGYGDLVTYKIANGETWVFRVVGLPLDTISIADNVVSINHKICKTALVKEFKTIEFSILELEEVLPNGHKHILYKLSEPIAEARNNVNDTIIPAGHYYLLGDNRDNAADSRFNGFISKDQITGRIVYSYWGDSKERMNLNFLNK